MELLKNYIMQTSMYRGSPPIFDVPEFPPLRRVKPLPKRRRTLENASVDLGDLTVPNDLLASDPTADDLAHTLSTAMALQSYYMPILNGVQDTLKRDTDRHSDVGYGRELRGGGNAVGRDDTDQGDGDYIDHLQQPGNTKKRKVPAANISPSGDAQETTSAGEEEPSDRSIPTGSREATETIEFTSAVTSFGGGATIQGKRKLTRATNACLQHKEMLRSRKRQLATVLGALSHGDTLALDQALSSNYPFSKLAMRQNGKDGIGHRLRLSRRPVRRIARATQHSTKTPANNPSEASYLKFPSCAFTFEWPSTTSERVIATKEEVASLHIRFDEELSRQAAKAAEAARQAALAVSQMQKSKGGDRTQQRMRSDRPVGGGLANEQSSGLLDRAAASPKTKGKKKKRSALANASNPHHLRNYVPSRLPHSGQAPAANSGHNYLGPPPLRFLSAEIPPRRKKTHQAPLTPLVQLTNPEDEWMCALCEYRLFYGDEASYRRSIRSRKKILSRRRRARERAAAAASGKKMVAPVDLSGTAGTEMGVGYDGLGGSGDVAVEVTKQVKSRGERDRDKERGDIL